MYGPCKGGGRAACTRFRRARLMLHKLVERGDRVCECNVIIECSLRTWPSFPPSARRGLGPTLRVSKLTCEYSAVSQFGEDTHQQQRRRQSSRHGKPGAESAAPPARCTPATACHVGTRGPMSETPNAKTTAPGGSAAATTTAQWARVGRFYRADATSPGVCRQRFLNPPPLAPRPAKRAGLQ